VHQYVVLVFLLLGANFFYDNPVALQNTNINVSTYYVCFKLPKLYWVQD